MQQSNTANSSVIKTKSFVEEKLLTEIRAFSTYPLRAEAYTRPFVEPLYLYAACIGAMIGGYTLKNHSITLGSIGGGLLALKIASTYLGSVTDPSKEEKRYNAAQTENEREIVDAKESEQKQQAVLEDIRSNIQNAFSSLLHSKEKLSNIQKNIEETRYIAARIHKTVSAWKESV